MNLQKFQNELRKKHMFDVHVFNAGTTIKKKINKYTSYLTRRFSEYSKINIKRCYLLARRTVAKKLQSANTDLQRLFSEEHLTNNNSKAWIEVNET